MLDNLSVPGSDNSPTPEVIYNDAGWCIKRPGYVQMHWNPYEDCAHGDCTCSTCDGWGQSEIGVPCWVCMGDGFREIDVFEYDMYRYLTADIEYYDL